MGHIASYCKPKLINHIEESDGDDEDNTLGLFSIFTSAQESKRYTIHLSLDEKDVLMEIDTGSACTIVNEAVYKQELANYKLDTPSVNLKSYSGQKV